MAAINIIILIAAAIMLCGVIGERDPQRQCNISVCFVALIALLISVNWIS